MKLYVNHLGQWAGNQDDARSYGHAFDQVEVPYDKKGLLKFRNISGAILLLILTASTLVGYFSIYK